MAVALMDYSSLCLTALRLPADAAQQRLFGKVIKKVDVILAFICNNPLSPRTGNGEMNSPHAGF